MKRTITVLLFGIFFLGMLSNLSAQCVKVKTLTNLTLENGSYVRTENGYDLVLEADQNGSASLVDRNSTNHVTHDASTETQDQLYVEDSKWHYISSPVQDEVSGAFVDMYLYDWDEDSQTWSWNSPVYIPLTPMKGWALWSPSSVGSVTRTFTGDFNSGNQSYSLTRNDPNAACPVGANLIGNPYPSSLDWESTSGWTTTNVGPTIYMWNSSTGNTGTYNKNTNTSQNGIDSIIPPKQGFFVTVNTGSTTGDIQVGNDARLHDNSQVYKSGEENIIPNALRLSVSSAMNSYSDEALVVFNQEASAAYDDMFDAFKIKGLEAAPQLYTYWNGVEYAVNTLKKMDKNLSIPLYFEAGVNGVYTLKANTDGLPDGTELYLEDTQTGKYYDLIANPEHDFSASKGDEASRFVLHFAAPDGMEESQAPLANHVFAYKNEIHVNTPADFSGEIKIYDMLGQLVMSKQLTQTNTIIRMDTPADYYIVKLLSASGVDSYKIFVKQY